MKIDDLKGASTGKVRFVTNENGESVPIPLEIQQILPIGDGENLFSYYSHFFLSSAESLKAVSTKTGNAMELGNVPVFLYLHYLELTLKSKLFDLDTEGLTTDRFGKKYGHNINKLLEKLETHGKDWKNGLATEQTEFIEKIGDDYKGKLYNYADGINPSNPLNVDIIGTSEIVKKIIENINK